jgi:ABC-type transport system involved in multi-copper enzyme maturation permease subunit
MSFSFSTLLVGMGLMLVQTLAALPWVLVGFARREVLARGAWHLLNDLISNRKGLVLLTYFCGGFLGVAAAVSLLFFALTRDQNVVENWGQVYGAVLQLQLTLDFFVLVFPLLLWVWPKGGAVAQAAFREGIRQPMFWLLLAFALLAMGLWPWIPYFTFGEDYTMVKELGYDTVTIAAVVFGVLAATLFVSEEIEGRTAVTLMSKPVSRRQFLLGKFVGILLVGLLMFGLLGEYFESTLLLKRYIDRLDPLPAAGWVRSLTANNGLPADANDFVRGAALWTSLSVDTLPGLVLSFCRVMVLVSIAIALATRLPMVLNLVLVISVFLVSHLTPTLVGKARRLQELNPGSVVAQMLSFVSQVFDTLLPGLDFFRVDQVLVTDAPPEPGPYALYVLSVLFYALLYTVIVMLFGLVLFEDRDLA